VEKFKINEFLTLKLERGNTNIYVNEERFIHCKNLILINIPLDIIAKLEDFKSMDDIAETLGWTSVIRIKGIGSDFTLLEYELDPETKFWAHCSILQAWYENDYNTLMLHSNLAFPLLKELARAGDSLAKRVIRNEIKFRFIEGSFSVREFLVEEGYLNMLSSGNFNRIGREVGKELIPFIRKMNEATFQTKYHERTLRKLRSVALLSAHPQYQDSIRYLDAIKIFIPPNMTAYKFKTYYKVFIDDKDINKLNFQELDSNLRKIDFSYIKDDGLLRYLYRSIITDLIEVQFGEKRGRVTWNYDKNTYYPSQLKISVTPQRALEWQKRWEEVNYDDSELEQIFDKDNFPPEGDYYIKYMKAGIDIAEFKKPDFDKAIATHPNDILGIDLLTPLKELRIFKFQVKSDLNEFTKLSKLINLEFLYLILNIENINGLENLTALKTLILCDNRIKKISGLETLSQLENLILSDNEIEKIEGIEHLKKLKELDLSNNKIKKIEALDNFHQLSNLMLSNNQIRDLGGLSSLLNLESLDISSNLITSIDYLGKLDKLRSLYLDNNNITNLKELGGLAQLRTLSLNKTPIKLEHLEVLKDLPSLTSIKVRETLIPEKYIEGERLKEEIRDKLKKGDLHF